MHRLHFLVKKLMGALRWESITSTDFVFFVGGLYVGLRILICSTFICGFFIELCRFMGFPVVVEVLIGVIGVIRRMPWWRNITSNKSIFLIAFYFMLRLTGSRQFFFFLINELTQFVGFVLLVDILVILLAKQKIVVSMNLLNLVLKKIMGALPWRNMKAYDLFVLLVFLFYYGFWKFNFFDWFRIRNKNNWRFVILREIAECIGFFFLVIFISKFVK